MLLDGAHAAFESLPRLVRPHRRRVVRGAVRLRQAALELALQELNLGARELIERLQILVCGDARVGDDQDAVLHVVERQHRVEQHEPGIVFRRSRRPRGILPGLRQRRLEQRRGVVADEADGAARETRQAGDVRRLELRHDAADDGNERLVGVAADAGAIDGGSGAARLEHEERILAEERIARDALATLDALEQEGVVGVLGDLQERGDRREQVRDDLLHHRHERAAARQFHELFVCRLFHD